MPDWLDLGLIALCLVTLWLVVRCQHRLAELEAIVRLAGYDALGRSRDGH